jgi:ribonuclease HI/exonuclease III
MEIHILQWNANGLRAHDKELRQFIATTETKPNIICVQETFLKPQQAYDIKGYSIERRDRLQGSKGGIATLIMNSLSYTVIDSALDIEALTVQVTSNKGKLNITNVYNPPVTTLDKDAYDKLFTRRNVVILGDMNSFSTLWGSPKTDSNGRKIETLLETHGLVTLNSGEGTYIKHQGDCSHLDLTIVSRHLAAKASWTVLSDSWGSDHLPVLTCINEKPALQNMTYKRWALNRANWDSYREKCRSLPSQLRNDESTEIAYQNLVSGIIAAATASIPQISVSPHFTPVPYWSKACGEAIASRNSARNRMNRTHLLDDCIDYRRLKAIAQRTLKDASKQYWQTYCSSLTSSSKLGSVWKMAKKMSGTTTRQSMPNLEKDGVSHQTNSEKANILAACYAEVSSNQNCTAEFTTKKKIMEEQWKNEKAMENEDAEKLNEQFQPHELRAAIDRCKNHTAPGLDSITYEMIKNLPEKMENLLLAIYNRLFIEGDTIASWKDSLVIPIAKPGANRTKPESYRPIALTAVLGKLFERLVVTRLEWFMEVNNLINPLQSGFRKQRSTIDQITRLQDDIHKAINNKEHTLAIFLDFSKAFDMVWKEGLLHKLRKIGIGGNMLNYINNFMSNRTIQVKVGDTLSQKYSMDNGTPQGSVISPLLFNIMINDIPSPEDPATKSSIFADDSSAWRSGRDASLLGREIQSHVNKVEEWSNQWGFKLSETKSTAVLFTHTNKSASSTVKLTINGTDIKLEKQAKFLGIIFDSRLTWKPHIDHIIDKSKKAINLLRSLCGEKWGASKQSLLAIYRTLIRSRIDYGCEAYYTASKAQLKRLDKIQSACLRKCSSAFCATAANAIQQDCGEMPLWIRRKRYLLRFATKVAANSTNPARTITQEHWKTAYGSFQEGKEPTHTIIQEYFKDRIAAPLAPRTQQSPPWHTPPPKVDITLSKIISKKEDPTKHIHARAMEIIATYKDTLHIYTDGSKMTESDRVAAAFYVEDIDYGHAERLQDGSTIYEAELAAIQLAIVWLKTANSQNKQPVTILTDSLSVVESIKTTRSISRPNTLADLLTSIGKLQCTVTFVWIPSHVGIPGNDRVDELAKIGTTRKEIEILSSHELSAEFDNIEAYVTNIWQKSYNEETAGSFYRKIEPTVSKKIKYQSKNRSKERLITRLRLGKCKLNKYLHDIAAHPDGLCNNCLAPETIQHLLMDCQHSEIPEKLINKCAAIKVEPTLVNILSNNDLIDLTYSLLTTLDRNI